MKDKLSRLSLIIAYLIGGAFFLASSAVYAGNEVSEKLHDPVDSSYENGLSGLEPAAWAGEDGLSTIENWPLDEDSVNNSLELGSSTPETGIGMGVAPYFDTYGVFRTASSHDKSAYVALGYISDEWTTDEEDALDNNDPDGFSYGFGVNNASSNFEYMMSVKHDSREVSAIGMRFVSEF